MKNSPGNSGVFLLAPFLYIYPYFVIMPSESKVSKFFDQFSGKVSKVTGGPIAFICSFLIVIVWGICGPIFHYSDQWQWVINTGTSIITFLMVFLIQQAQNKDTLALQIKLNELIAATKGASNRVINIEDMTEEELKVLKSFYIKLNDITKEEKAGVPHSIDEAEIENAVVNAKEGKFL